MISSLYSAVIIGLGTSVLVDRLEAKAESRLHPLTASHCPAPESHPAADSHQIDMLDVVDVIDESQPAPEVLTVIDDAEEPQWRRSSSMTSSVSDYNLVR